LKEEKNKITNRQGRENHLRDIQTWLRASMPEAYKTMQQIIQSDMLLFSNHIFDVIDAIVFKIIMNEY